MTATYAGYQLKNADNTITLADAANSTEAVSLGQLTTGLATKADTATTLAGYGITDAYPLSGNPSGFLTSVPAQSFSSLTGKPTTLSGYGITDAQSKLYSGNFSQSVVAVTTFTVTIGTTLGGTTYETLVTPTVLLSAAAFYVTNKTTTTFDVVFVSALTGTVKFDWQVTP